MAILHYKEDDPFKPMEYNIKEYAIGGKLLTVSYDIDDSLLGNISKDSIKERMAIQLARSMLDKGLIEYTSLRSPTDYGLRVHARCYLAPNDQVKIIRELKDARI